MTPGEGKKKNFKLRKWGIISAAYLDASWDSRELRDTHWASFRAGS